VRAGFEEIEGGAFSEHDERAMSPLAAAVKRRGRKHLAARNKARRRSTSK
jgi:hypothetical protein